MAYTLKDLQNTEFGILCQFADFCDAHNIPYGLSGGTLLGAVRHNGFIPWDDDIDVHMDVKAFKKFVRCIRKHPIPGLHFTWIDTDPEYPFFFAKLRKNGTFMMEEYMQSLDVHSGVWLDIFAYTRVPKIPAIAKLQKKFFSLFCRAGYLFKLKQELVLNPPPKVTARARLAQKMSFATIRRLRKLFFFLYTNIGVFRSDTIHYNSWETKDIYTYDDEMPLCRHEFEGRQFWIPQNYDVILRKQYGDYMTPVEFPSHTDLPNIQL